MITEEAIMQGFNQGFDCSMQVAAELSGDVGLTKEQGLKIMSCFGVGAGQRTLCGAVSGAMMAIGYRYGNTEPGDMATKGLCMSKREEFYDRFMKEFGTLTCPGLMGVDLTDPEGAKKANEEGLIPKVCPRVCMFAIRTARDLIRD